MPITDPFASQSAGLNSPARNVVAITPDDSNDLTTAPRALYIGGGGDVKVLAIGDSTPQTFTGLPTGSILPVVAKRVYAAGTTATLILGMY